MIPVLIPVAFIPMICFLIWIRNSEKYNKESWKSLIFVFLWGAIIATGMSIILEDRISNHISTFFILAVIVAPIVEEFAKPLSLRLIKKNITEVEDGLIYGAVAGLLAAVLRRGGEVYGQAVRVARAVVAYAYWHGPPAVGHHRRVDGPHHGYALLLY